MTSQHEFEATLRRIQTAARGASRMTRRLAYIYELAAAALEGRPVAADIKSPHERMLQWRDARRPPGVDDVGQYVVRLEVDVGRRDRANVGIALWMGDKWSYSPIVSEHVDGILEYLTMRIPTEKK